VTPFWSALTDALKTSPRATNALEPGRTRPEPAHDDIVVLKDIRKSYGTTEVLKGIDLVAKRGETTVIIGGSGAGKTTLLRLIVALEQPTSGELRIEGENIIGLGERALNKVRQKFGMVYQYAALLDSINVLDNVSFPLVEHTKMKATERKERVVKMLKELGLDESACAKFPSELSGGMRKRVGMARALMLDPRILIYDEPTSGLDPPTSRMVDDLIDEMRQKFGVTSVVISHDIASCFRIAHQAVLLINGQIVARGTPDALMEGSNAEAKKFIEMSGVDIKHVTRVGKADHSGERRETSPAEAAVAVDQ
jgi:phospholipid/cholesterol/gamma-HCH transport system ATP-binding protein